MRVLLNGSYAPSLVNFRGSVIRELIARGHDVHCSAPEPSADIIDVLEGWGATVHAVPLSRTGLAIHQDAAYFFRLRSLIGAVAPNLVINYTIKPNIYGSLAARSRGVRSVSMITGLGFSFIPDGRVRQRLTSRVVRHLYRAATSANDAVVFQNPDDRQDFVAAGCLADPQKAKMVNGSGVDTGFYASSPLPSEAVFLMVARLLGNKGVREFGRAAASLLEEGVEARFLLAGYFDEGPDGIEPDELKQWQASGLEYLGPLEDVRPALAQASVFVLPSYREGTPRSVLEAMSAGRAIITTNVPGCRQTIVDGESGLLVPLRDSGSLADAMRALAANPSLRARMGNAARRRCEDIFAVEKVTEDLLGQLGLQ